MTEKIMRVSLKFANELEKIKDQRLLKGKDRERIATKKLTALIVTHLDWDKIKQSLINASEKEIKIYGK